MFDFISISFFFKNKQTQFEVVEMATLVATRQRIANGDASLELEPGAGHPKERSSMRVIFLFTNYSLSSFLQ